MWAGGGVLLLTAWGAWLGAADLPVYAHTTQARIQTLGAPCPIEAVVGGRVLDNWMEIGRVVQAGDPLVVLDATDTDQRLAQAMSRRDAMEHRLEALQEEHAAARLRRFVAKAHEQDAVSVAHGVRRADL